MDFVADEDGTYGWAIKDCLVNTTSDPGYLVPKAAMVVARLMNGRRTVSAIAAAASMLIARPVLQTKVYEVADTLRALGLLQTEESAHSLAGLRRSVEASDALDHSWLPLYKDPVHVLKALEEATDEPSSAPLAKGILVPHVTDAASYRLSAVGVKRLSQASAPLLVVIGPNHVTPHIDGVVLGTKPFRTLFGKVDVDASLAQVLADRSAHLFRIDNLVHQQEHSIALQVPFIRRILPPDTRLLPMLVSFRDIRRWGSSVESVVGHLRACLEGQRYSLLLTGDLLHYYPELARIWSMRFSMSHRRMGRLLLEDPGNAAQRGDAALFARLQAGQVKEFAMESYQRGDCVGLPLLLGWTLSNAKTALAIAYDHAGAIAAARAGVSIAVLELR